MNSLNYAVERSSNKNDLIRIVHTFGGEKDVSRIILVGEKPFQVLASTRSDWIGCDLKKLPDIISIEVAQVFKDNAMVVFSQYQNENFLHMGKPIFLIGEKFGGSFSNGVIILHMDKKYLKKSLIEFLGFEVIIFFVFLGILSLLVIFQFNGIIFKPLQQVIRVIRKRAEGDEHALMPMKYSTEINELAQAYNHMVEIQQDAQKKLAESEEKFRTIADYIYDWEYWIAPNFKEFIYISPACEKITGYTAEELYNDPDLIFHKMVHPDDLSLVKEHFENESLTEEPASVEYRIISKDGKEKWIDHYCQAVYTCDNVFAGRRASNRDISDRKKVENALQKANDNLEQRVEERTFELKKIHDQLIHAEKLSAIGTLSASIAHEFNNPLQGVLSIINGVSNRAILDEDDTKLMSMAMNECYRMRDLIKSLQDFNRPTSGKIVQMDIHAALDSLLLLGKSEYLLNKICIVKRYAENMPLIKAVADQVKQVFLNLLNNAVDACTGAGTITVETKILGEKVVVRIHDTGTGIKPEDKDHLFEPFFTTKPAVKGIGLGLSVSYGIIKRHNGEIKVDSELGKGTTFSIFLPIGGTK
ncbi:PAS/PAC sensor signal transduction histidine kinase [Candidatus Magnetomorum sp. HK-1]|nr:PAS/PAC sensor signal transduction histidine kinase [Candidatus Magnetomorum sp. HK-1]